jgi:hypothetical protein
LSTKRNTACVVGTPGPGLGQAQRCGGVKRDPNFSLFIIGYSIQYRYKQIITTTFTDSLPLKKTTHYHKNE